MPLTRAQAASEVMWHLVTHDAHGYSQYHRAGDGTVETFYLSDGTLVSIHGGDYDCSEAIRACVAALLLIPWDYWDSYMWTGNEPEILLNAGFIEISPYDAGVGDILLRYSGHTEMVVGGWDGELYQAGFRIAETGGIDGEQGDQTGWESAYSPYDPSANWDVAFRYAGTEREKHDKQQTKESEEDEMVCLIQPDGQSRLVYYDGVNVHTLHHEDEAGAIREVYRATHGGREIPQIQLGSPDAPWANRFMNAVQRLEAPWPSMV